jgi:oxepin-CoA hydrolase/3-oxo-5,6-dehydrosuberyl-CoA semialdehyde dehydrogenase
MKLDSLIRGQWAPLQGELIYIAKLCVLADGAFQFIIGPTGNRLNNPICQDVVSFTEMAETSEKLQHHPLIARHAGKTAAPYELLTMNAVRP